MPTEKRVVLKDFNRDVLHQELTASPLPFVDAQLSGFERVGPFVGVPRAEPKLVTRRRLPDGTYFEDWAPPGELRFEFSVELSVAEALALDDLLAAHTPTQRTTKQQRREQDETDLDMLITNFPNWDSFTAAQRNNFLKALSRVVLRKARDAEI